MWFGQLLSSTTFYGPASNTTSHGHVPSLMGSAFNEGRLLSCQDPCPIAEIPSDPRSIPYRSSDSILYTNQTPKLQAPLNLQHITITLQELQTTSKDPNHIPYSFVFIIPF